MSYCFGYDRIEMATTLTKEEALNHLKTYTQKIADYIFNPDTKVELESEEEDECEYLYDDEFTSIEEAQQSVLDRLNVGGFLKIEDNLIKMSGCTEEGDALGFLNGISLHFLPFMATNYCEGWSGYYDSKEGVGGDTYFLNKDGDFISSRKLAEIQLG